MTELATPTAKRLQRPSWKDSRLIVGVLLVAVAGTLGAKAVASADDRTAYYVAAEDLVAGDRITSTSFKRVDVRLDDAVTRYLLADAPIQAGGYLLRDVRVGELVPVSAVGGADQVEVQRVTVRADSVSTTGLARGDRVDVYVTPKDTPTGSSQSAKRPMTTRVLQGAPVAAVLTSAGGFGSSSTTSVQVYVPTGDVQAVVEAVDSGAKLTLVPVVGTGGA